jgi:predicted ATPase
MRKIVKLNFLIIVVIAFLTLASRTIPLDSQQYIHEKVEGGPFYLEKAIKVLIDSKILYYDNGEWHLTGQISELAKPSTNHGVRSARYERLDKEIKRIL